MWVLQMIFLTYVACRAITEICCLGEKRCLSRVIGYLRGFRIGYPFANETYIVVAKSSCKQRDTQIILLVLHFSVRDA